MSDAPTPLLTARDLRRDFAMGEETVHAVRGVSIDFDAGALNRSLVLENNVVFGSVNANRRHWRAAAEALRAADPGWLGALITRRVGVEAYAEAYRDGPDGIKTVIDFS